MCFVGGARPIGVPLGGRGTQTGDREKEVKGEGSGQAAGDVTVAVLLRRWEEEWSRSQARTPAAERGSVQSRLCIPRPADHYFGAAGIRRRNPGRRNLPGFPGSNRPWNRNPGSHHTFGGDSAGCGSRCITEDENRPPGILGSGWFHSQVSRLIQHSRMQSGPVPTGTTKNLLPLLSLKWRNFGRTACWARSWKVRSPADCYNLRESYGNAPGIYPDNLFEAEVPWG